MMLNCFKDSQAKIIGKPLVVTVYENILYFISSSCAFLTLNGNGVDIKKLCKMATFNKYK